VYSYFPAERRGGMLFIFIERINYKYILIERLIRSEKCDQDKLSVILILFIYFDDNIIKKISRPKKGEI